MFKLFIDDIRIPKSSGWIIARSSNDAIEIVKKNGIPLMISFDHDLGGEDTSMKFIKWFTDYLIDNSLNIPVEFSYNVHSANPVGSKNIASDMDLLIKHFSKRFR